MQKRTSINDFIIPDLLPPSEDGVFKTLLTHPDAGSVLRDVIESFLHFPVTNVQVRNNELPISDINEKRERFDVNCSVNDGSQIEIEMQSQSMKGDSQIINHKIIKDRSVYYLCDLHSKQAGRGIRFDKLLRSFQVTFCDFTVFPERADFINKFRFRDEKGMDLSDATEIIFIELSKLGDIINKPADDLTGEEQWNIFFAYGGDRKYIDLINRLCEVRNEIKMAKEVLNTISRDENERARFRARWKFERDMEHNLAVAQDEVKEEIAKNAIIMGMTNDVIVQLTGLTIKEVEALRIAH